MPSHNIYALCEPDDGKPRYVGQTAFPLKHRLSNHIASARVGKSNNGLSNWINGLVASGKRPAIVLLEECAQEDAVEAETTWIALCGQQGCSLFNIAQLPKLPKPPKKERKPGQLTKGNIKMLGVPSEVHADAVDLARRDGLKVYEVVAKALDLYRKIYSNGKAQQ